MRVHNVACDVMILEHLGKLQEARIVLASGSPRRLEILNEILKLCVSILRSCVIEYENGAGDVCLHLTNRTA